MRYKREEGFRYAFEVPLEATFQIIKINDEHIESKTGKAFIYDISPRGLKLSTELDLYYKKNQIEVRTTFTLQSEHTVTGEIVCQDENYREGYFYGIDLHISDDSSSSIVHELKHYVKDNHFHQD